MFTEHNDYEHPHDRLEKMPLFRKGKEIQDVVCMIASLIDDEALAMAKASGLGM